MGGKTFAECTQLCLDREGCEFFSYQHDSTRQCLLKGGHCCATRTTNSYPWETYRLKASKLRAESKADTCCTRTYTEGLLNKC